MNYATAFLPSHPIKAIDSRFDLSFFFTADFLAPHKKTGQFHIRHLVTYSNKATIACGFQMLDHMAGITGLAIVDDANIHHQSIRCLRKKMEEKWNAIK